MSAAVLAVATSYTAAQAMTPRHSAPHAGMVEPSRAVCPIARGARNALTMAAVPVRLRRQQPRPLGRRRARPYVVPLASQNRLRLWYTKVLQHSQAQAVRAPGRRERIRARPGGLLMKRVSRRYRSRSRSGVVAGGLAGSYSSSGPLGLPGSGFGTNSAGISSSGIPGCTICRTNGWCRSRAKP